MSAHTCPEPRRNGWRCILAGPHQVTADGRVRHVFVKGGRA